MNRGEQILREKRVAMTFDGVLGAFAAAVWFASMISDRFASFVSGPTFYVIVFCAGGTLPVYLAWRTHRTALESEPKEHKS